MDMIPIPPDFKEFLSLLYKNKVEYLLIGGYAVAYHGFLRTTGDIDIWIAVNPTNVAKVVQTISEFGFPEITVENLLTPGRMVRMGIAPVRIEVLTQISGVDFSDCYKNRIIEPIDNFFINIIDFDNLKRNKAASGRLKDLADLSQLPKD